MKNASSHYACSKFTNYEQSFYFDDYRLISSRGIISKVGREFIEEEVFPTGSLKHLAFSLDTKQVLLSF